MGCANSNESYNQQLFNHLLVHTRSSHNPQIADATQKNKQISPLDRSISYYQQLIQQHQFFNHPFNALGNPDDIVGYFQGHQQKWYNSNRQSSIIYGNPYDALSLCLCIKDDASGALIWYEGMLKKYPFCYQLHFGLGNLYYKLGDYQRAEQQYKAAFQINPRLQKAYQNIANLYCFKLFDNKKAQEWCKFSLRINPNNQYSLFIKALLTQKLESRIVNLLKLHLKFPKYSRICSALGYAYLQGQNLEQAIGWFNKGYAINKSYYAICCGLAMAYNKQCNYQVALSWVQKALSLNQKHHEPYITKGDILKGNKQFEEAQLYYLKAIQLNKEFEAGYISLISMFQQTNNVAKTNKYLKQLIKLNPSGLQISNRAKL